MLLLPVVLLLNAQNPTAVLFEAVLQYRAKWPNPVLLLPVVFNPKALFPTATL